MLLVEGLAVSEQPEIDQKYSQLNGYPSRKQYCFLAQSKNAVDFAGDTYAMAMKFKAQKDELFHSQIKYS